MAIGRNLVRYAAASALLLGSASSLQAQVLGTFVWRFAPFCNVVTVTVEQQGAAFLLNGHDDRCGQPIRATVTGTAQLNPNGTAGLGLTVLRPDGRAIHNQVILNVATLNGTWEDSYGNSGTFLFNPALPAPGSPRQITIRGNYAINYQAAAAGHNGMSPFSFGETLTAAPTAVGANFIPSGGAPTANCPGSPTTPEAAPGHLCVYERLSANATGRCITRTGGAFSCNVADRYGAAIFAEAVAAGNVATLGSWAVTIPH